MFFVSFRQLLDPIDKKRLKKCQISEKRQLRDDFFKMKSKPKTVFALVPTLKLILLGCFSLANDNSKTRLKKGG